MASDTLILAAGAFVASEASGTTNILGGGSGGGGGVDLPSPQGGVSITLPEQAGAPEGVRSALAELSARVEQVGQQAAGSNEPIIVPTGQQGGGPDVAELFKTWRESIDIPTPDGNGDGGNGDGGNGDGGNGGPDIPSWLDPRTPNPTTDPMAWFLDQTTGNGDGGNGGGGSTSTGDGFDLQDLAFTGPFGTATATAAEIADESGGVINDVSGFVNENPAFTGGTAAALAAAPFTGGASIPIGLFASGAVGEIGIDHGPGAADAAGDAASGAADTAGDVVKGIQRELNPTKTGPAGAFLFGRDDGSGGSTSTDESGQADERTESPRPTTTSTTSTTGNTEPDDRTATKPPSDRSGSTDRSGDDREKTEVPTGGFGGGGTGGPRGFQVI